MDTPPNDFIRARIIRDLNDGTVKHQIITRFPPEPNGFLHIGHAKSICLNFGVADEFCGQTYLRFDDTNPLTESEGFVEAIKKDVNWLGYDWGDRLTFASDYFEQIYAFAEELVVRGCAFVCDLSAEELQATRGTLTTVGQNSPFRDRSIDENLTLLRKMKAGDFATGSRVLRAKIDMSSPNLNLRDPVLYRIIHAPHHRTGDQWCIYPMYDFTHCICDALEGITHSLCTLEFEDHRALYDWVLDNININFHPPQIEFSRLNLEHTITSKRVLRELVDQQFVNGWDDPRMPTLAGLRNRGVPPAAIRDFCRRVGVTKQENTIETELLDFCIRSELEEKAPRCMVVRDPLLLEVTNFSGEDLSLTANWHPKLAEFGMRELVFGRKIYIDRADFSEDPPPKYKRLIPGGMVRLRYAFIVRCDEIVKDDAGKIICLKVTYFPDSRSGNDTSGLKPKGVIQFVAENNALPIEIRDYEHLFLSKTPSSSTWFESLNSNSMTVSNAVVERAVFARSEQHWQFERLGYYFHSPCHDLEVKPVFHRTVSLSQRW
ncbi:MAG: glutamine--tRNA ligase/YqeY domain fusion protein [Gammaproteobacteria bacterium]|nr:glutamine--tRNA ligase/YqeY domain fusion protein [Gammaproteobacteria bacterium]MDE0251661.1 glutamine--tRNA ligase/YqeY domain fusion protein [Gammaproteobacteria bacterium]MDE0403329.1 glutamine--tRNA ligase/YqeY domain fusion protein [Gammaproteobacteria bacterium]